jgi:methylated-DNA-[protein]-cysteine S-methyltransferase
MDHGHFAATAGFTLFETALGWAGAAWRAGRITAVALPSAEPHRARARLRRREAAEADPPEPVAEACALMAALLAGDPVDLRGVAVDDDRLPPFDRGVYAIARTIPPGKTATYGDVARRLGDVDLARDVGAALGRNPTPLVVPCHRVVAANGRLGGFSAPGGRETKRRLLELERAHAEPAGRLFAI